MRSLLLRSLLLAAWLWGCGGIAVIEETTEDQPEDVDLGPSKSRWSFELPSEGTPNDNGYIGPFCCTGVTAVVVSVDGRELGYGYFFIVKGQPYQTKNGAFAPDFAILLAAQTDLADATPPMEFAKGEIAFTAGELVSGLSRSADAGGLRFTATIEHADIEEWSLGPMFNMFTLTVRLDVDPLQ